MRAKSLLHEMESYLKSEVELSLKPFPRESACVAETGSLLAQKLESDRSRLLRVGCSPGSSR